MSWEQLFLDFRIIFIFQIIYDLKFSYQLYTTKSSQAIGHIHIELVANISTEHQMNFKDTMVLARMTGCTDPLEAVSHTEPWTGTT
jgi:hypothetical protein